MPLSVTMEGPTGLLPRFPSPKTLVGVELRMKLGSTASQGCSLPQPTMSELHILGSWVTPCDTKLFITFRRKERGGVMLMTTGPREFRVNVRRLTGTC